MKPDLHTQQEQELAKIASTKFFNSLGDIADESVCVDCGFDEYHNTIDSIELGLSKAKSNKRVWSVEYQGEVEDCSIFLFIADKYEEVKDKIEALPNKFTPEQRQIFVEKIEKTIPGCRLAEFDSPDGNVCRFIVDEDKEAWHGKIVDGIRLQVC